MKAKRVTKTARGRFAKALVFRGSKEKTAGGLKSDDLMKNKRGKVVSKRANAHGKRRYRNVEQWVESVMEAREALYVKARSLRAAKFGGGSLHQPCLPQVQTLPVPAV